MGAYTHTEWAWAQAWLLLYVYVTTLECVAIDCGLAFDDLFTVVRSQEPMTETCSSHPSVI